MPNSICFVHQNYPAQFGNLAKYLVKQGWEVYYATAREGVERGKIKTIDGVHLIGFERHREKTKGVHRYIEDIENSVLNAQAFAQLAVKMRNSGVNPDIVVAHSGWGSGAFTKSIWPNTKFVQYIEWWYTYPSKDNYLEHTKPEHEPHRIASTQCKNLNFLLDTMQADAIWAPTKYQAEDIPKIFRNMLRVEFDGVDSDFFAPQKRDELQFNDVKINIDDQIVTYATRGMEPQRGFMEFMEAVSRLQAKRDKFKVVIAGEPTIHYSAKLPEGDNYKKRALAQWEYDHDRLHFTGRLEFPKYRDLLARSDAHVYLTKPFVTSWSCFEAASTGSPMIISDGENTREILPKNEMANFVDHRDIDALVEKIEWVLDHQKTAREMGARARKRIINHYSQKKVFPSHEKFLLKMIEN